MADRMTKDRWEALFTALSIGIDEMEESVNIDDSRPQGEKELELENARKAYRILLHRRYKA